MPWKKGNRLKLVPQSDAAGQTREIYDDIKQTLGLPDVSTMHEAFAVYPRFLELHWQAFRPVLRTREFFALADRLRADAYTRAFNYFEVPDLASALDAGVRDQLCRLTELLQYKDSLLLLIAAAQFQAFGGPVGRLARPIHPAEPHAYPHGPELVEEQHAPPEVRRIYDDLRRTFGFPFVSYDYRALARWPEFLGPYWNVLKDRIESPIYEGIHHGICESAWTLARELPEPVELTVGQLLDAGMTDEDVASVVRITELFVQSLSRLMLNMGVARIGVESGTKPLRKLEEEKEPHKERAA